MKVSDVMSKHVDSVNIDTKVADVARLIFGRGINGVPVCKKGKVVGFITERDILSKFYPSMQEYIEDPVHAADFEEMEKKASEVISLNAQDIMSKHPVTVLPDTPLLRSQSLMFIQKVGRLPVVDKTGKLVGILTKGDIFKAIIGKKMAFDVEEEFFDWMAKYYDIFMDWKKRIAKEIPSIVSLLKKEGIETVIDIGPSTGEHSIALAKKGFSCFGIEASSLMIEQALAKREKLPKAVKERINFVEGTYKNSMHKLPKNLDCAIFMGNALSHAVDTDKEILKETVSILNPKKSVMVFQLLNLEKILRNKNGFSDFTLRRINSGKQIAFLTFYNKDKHITGVRSVFEYDGDKWYFKGVRTNQVVNIGKEKIVQMLKKVGYNNIEFFGSSYWEPLFKTPFDPLRCDWLNVVAKRH